MLVYHLALFTSPLAHKSIVQVFTLCVDRAARASGTSLGMETTFPAAVPAPTASSASSSTVSSLKVSDIQRSSVSISAPLQLSLFPSDIRLKVGQSADLLCEATSAVMLTWLFRYTSFLPGNVEVVEGPTKSSLTIHNMTADNGGEYVCVATLAGSSPLYAIASVIFLEAITIEVVPNRDVLVAENGATNFTCTLTCGCSGTQLTWQRGGSVLPSTALYSRLCWMASVDVHLQVNASSSIPPLLPTISIVPGVLSIAEGLSANFTCNSSQPAQFVWSFNAVAPLPGNMEVQNVTSTVSVLRVVSAGLTNAGSYYCKALFADGQATTAYADLIFIETLKVKIQSVYLHSQSATEQLLVWAEHVLVPSPLNYYHTTTMAGEKARVPPGAIPNSMSFALGGLAGMTATVFVQPLDLLKNRMQLSGEGGAAREYKTSFHAFASIVKKEGIFGIYNGLSAGLLRQATYSTVRLGVFQSLTDKLSSSDRKPPGAIVKILMGMTAGACGAMVGNPADISLIRMTADGRLPAEQRRGYTNVFNALARITREEGILTLWRQFLLSTSYFTDNVMCHFVASMISGLVTTIVSMPVDIAKTRVQNMKIVNGVPEYRGAVDVLKKVIEREGVLSLWKGFTPYYARLGPHTVLTFVFLEQFRILYYRTFVPSHLYVPVQRVFAGQLCVIEAKCLFYDQAGGIMDWVSKQYCANDAGICSL
ncbi:hypothetical protein EMCRGX_G017043 [Ephydatia muelleri]